MVCTRFLQSKGHDTEETKKGEKHFCMRHIVLTYYSFLQSCMKISQMVTDLWGVEFLKEIVKVA